MDTRPFLALALVGAGALAGAALERVGGPHEVPQVAGPAEPTDDDATIERFRASLDAAQSDVSRLDGALRDAEERLAAARSERDRAVDARGNLGRLVRTLEGDVVKLRGELGGASERRDDLLLALADAAEALRQEAAAVDQLAGEVEGWRRATTVTAWDGFVSEAKVSLCDRGSRRRHARCHDAVHTALGESLRAEFEACVASGQALPVLRKAGPDDGLPARAVWVERDARFTSDDWYVLLCDPTLPEAGGSADDVGGV